MLARDIQKAMPNCMFFVDDIVFLEESRGVVNLKLWRQTLKTKGFHLSRSKMEYMHCNYSKR